MSNRPLANGADIELIDTTTKSDAPTVTIPNVVIINGVEILLPEDADIEINPGSHKDVTTVRLTMFARSVSIRRAADDPTMSVSDYLDKVNG